MSVTTTQSRISYVGDGASVIFPFPYLFQNNADVEVWVNNVQMTAGFTTTGASNASLPAVGGEVTFVAAPAIGAAITLIRNPSTLQKTVIAPNDSFPAKTIETMVDAAMLAIQRLNDILALNPDENQLPVALSYPFQESNLSGALPPAATRAGGVLAFDASGLPTIAPLPSSIGAGNLTSEGPFVANVNFTPNVTTTLNLSQSYGTSANVSVHFDSAFQGTDQYAIVGNQIIFTQPIPAGVNKVYIVGGTSLSIFIPATNSVGDSQLAWGSVLSRVVDNVAAISSLNPAIYTRVFATGFANVADGGGGEYYYSSTSTATVDGGTVLASLTGIGRYLLVIRNVLSVKQLGAKGDGVTDDTAAVNACISVVGALGGGEAYFPSGTYNISATLTVPANVILKGNGGDGGVGGTTISLLSATLDGIVLNGARTGVSGFFMTSPVTRTGGRAIAMPIGLSSVDNVWIEHYNIGIEADGGLNFLTNINIRNPSSANSIGILINGSADQHITNLIIGADFSSPAAFAGVQVAQSGGLWMTDCDITLCQNGVLVNPQSGQEVQFLFLKNVTCDTSSNNGWTVAPNGTGFVAGMNMIGCWGASSVNSGMLFAPTGGAIIDGVWMSTPQVVNNSGIGINISGSGGPVKNFNITGGCVSGNSVTSPLAHDGIVIGVGCSNITLNGIRVGPSQNLGGDSQNNQINVLAGTQSDINITNCDVTTANTPITFSSTGSNNSIVNCPGYRTAQRITGAIQVGQASVAVAHNLNAPNAQIAAIVSPNVILGSSGANSLSVESTFGAGSVTVTANAPVTATLFFTLDLRAFNS